MLRTLELAQRRLERYSGNLDQPQSVAAEKDTEKVPFERRVDSRAEHQEGLEEMEVDEERWNRASQVDEQGIVGWTIQDVVDEGLREIGWASPGWTGSVAVGGDLRVQLRLNLEEAGEEVAKVISNSGMSEVNCQCARGTPEVVAEIVEEENWTSSFSDPSGLGTS